MGLNTRIKITDANQDSFDVSVHDDGDKLVFVPSSRSPVYVSVAEARELAEYLNARADEIEALPS